MHVAPELHRKLVEVDVPALDDHVRQLREVLIANGNTDSFLPQLRHISRVVGVPELSVRITTLATQWLCELGDYVGAVKELGTLGDLEQLNDTLALVLVTKLVDLPAHEERRYLTRAISSALSKGEKWFAELELVRHLSGCGEREKALRRVESVIAESTGTTIHRDALADALSLRWEITGKEEDFLTAKNELKTFADLEHQNQLAAILIDHGEFDQAERVLSDKLHATDPVAQLLTIDARVRAGRLDAARELLLNVATDCITARLKYPYAVVYSLVALACNDDELKMQAAANLRQVPSTGNRVKRNVNDLLQALKDRDFKGRGSIVARIYDLFTR